MGVDFGDELRELGHEVRLFSYRRDNPLYKNTPTKAAYQQLILRRLERVCADWRPERSRVVGVVPDSATVAPVAVTTSAAAAAVGRTKLELKARGRRARRLETR